MPPTLFNRFVMGTIEDSLDGIFEALREGAITMQQGGGVGFDFSTLRPRLCRLIMLGLRYGQEAARQAAAATIRTICHSAYRASARLAEEKGPFPHLERDA